MSGPVMRDEEEEEEEEERRAVEKDKPGGEREGGPDSQYCPPMQKA